LTLFDAHAGLTLGTGTDGRREGMMKIVYAGSDIQSLHIVGGAWHPDNGVDDSGIMSEIPIAPYFILNIS
jgi:hypothetical protein